jgi:ABC-2 type transport system permease protein
MLIAYGIVRDAPWSFFIMLIPFIVTFVVIPASIGSILCMLVVAGLPRLRLHALSISLAIAATGILWVSWATFGAVQSQLLTAAWFEETLSRLAMTEQVFLPSWWLSSGLLDAALRGESRDLTRQSTLEALKFLGLILANALLLSLVASWVARWTYRKGYSNLQAEVPIRRHRRLFWLDELLARAGSRVGNPIRLLLVKDLQIFRRDITQWSQFVIFFGLLGLYFYNLRSFNYTHVYASLIGHLNLAVVGLILSTFTTRFVFPSISLEGRRFWILGLLPIHRDQIVWSKFLFSFVGGLVPCLGLILLSDCMLGLPWGTVFVHLTCCLALCGGLSGIAVGMGASMPNFRESSPAKIAAGFGGTLSLVLSAMFIILIVITVGFTNHFNLFQQTVGQLSGTTTSWLPGISGGQVVSILIVIPGGLLATFLPLVLGIRAFRQLEP